MAEADWVLVSTNVVPMGGDVPAPGCVAVTGQRISRVAPLTALDSIAGEGTRVLDVGDRPVLPGFVDAHAHVEVACRMRYATVDARAPRCGSVPDVLDVLRDGLADKVFDGWLIAQANLFFDQKLEERRLPTREELDTVHPDVAIALRAGGHISVLNTEALRRLGIDERYTPPSGTITGRPLVERGADGRPTGVVREMDRLIPRPSLDGSALGDALREGVHDLFTRHGVTSIGEISESKEGVATFASLTHAGSIDVRLGVYLWVPGTVSLDEACGADTWMNPSAAPGRFRIQGVKLFADGGYSAANAAVKQPYVVGDRDLGKLAVEPDDVRRTRDAVSRAGMDLAIHANGDRAQESVCEAVAGVVGATSMLRLEHAGNFLPDHDSTVSHWHDAGIVPSPQPVFIYAFGDFFPVYLGVYGERGRFPFRRLLDEGWRLSASSDVWVGSEEGVTDPMFGVWCAVERRSFRGQAIEPEQAISVEDALRMYTIDAARALGREREIGSLEEGKLADIAVLASDPRTTAPGGLRDVQVDHVFHGGRRSFTREGAESIRESVGSQTDT